jgi:hypothetical protein
MGLPRFRHLLFPLLLISAIAEAGTVRLVNDTGYKLRAVIRAADGTVIGEVVVNPQQTMSWNDYWGGVGTYNQSMTPYTVAWYCSAGGDFSVCNNVSTGATVTAYGCSGNQSCSPKSRQPKPTYQQTTPPLPHTSPEQEGGGPPEGEVP